jgi:hypothetical protein
MTTEALHILAGWIGVSLGVLTGAVFGLAFHKENWLGGYNSWTRRMLRLGHISFFGIAFLNFMFAITTDLQALHGTLIQIYMDAIQGIQDAGITVNGCFVLGLDHSDTNSFDDIWEFVQKSGLYEVQITVMTPFPATPLYDRLLREGRILKGNAWELCTLFDINYQPKQMSVEELNSGLLALTQKLYSDDAVNTRVRRFFKRKKELSAPRITSSTLI